MVDVAVKAVLSVDLSADALLSREDITRLISPFYPILRSLRSIILFDVNRVAGWIWPRNSFIVVCLFGATHLPAASGGPGESLASPAPTPAVFALAELPIEGGLGYVLGEKLSEHIVGAELSKIPATIVSDDQQPALSPTSSVPGAVQSWRYLRKLTLPAKLKDSASAGFVMLSSDESVLRIIGKIQQTGCGADFVWLKKTLIKKYRVNSDPELTPADGFQKHMRVVFPGRQIDIRCGPYFLIDYADTESIQLWMNAQATTVLVEKHDAEVAKRRLILDRRRSHRFADSFTMGTKYRLDGGFGVRFGSPFAPNSIQQFPIDTPFIVVLPTMPDRFDDGEVYMTISPEKHPITIRGRFPSIPFDEITQALASKYGSPMKYSKRHAIHKISGKHAIVKRIDPGVEFVLIDEVEQEKQRDRLWKAESEGI